MKRFEHSPGDDPVLPDPERTASEGPISEEALELNLRITDAETCFTLRSFEDPADRDQFAQNALSFGCKILREASGSIDRHALRKEGSGIVEKLERVLQDGSRDSMRSLSEEFRRFLDPESGIFQQRLERLISGDGSELNLVLNRHLEKEAQHLQRLLEEHVGAKSELLKKLSPDQKDGLIQQFQEQFRKTLGEQSREILGQFSLDQEDSAINRLIRSISDSNGELKEELSDDVVRLQGEFSLDNKNSALNHIMNQLAKNEESIARNLTLDRDDSPMARMRKEFLELLEKENKESADFRAEVLKHFAEQNARKEEAARSTHQGLTFEDKVNDFIEGESRNKGDYFEATGSTSGKIGRKKVGDGVITLGPDTRAPGARIVIEAKKAQGYTLKKALDEIERARENREAQAGIFVFAADVVPRNVKPIDRYGSDIVVVWDPEDKASDAFLLAGITIARSLVIAEVNRSDSEVDLEGFERVVREIESQAGGIDKILTKARSVEKSGKDIAKLADDLRANILNQTQELDDLIDSLREDQA